MRIMYLFLLSLVLVIPAYSQTTTNANGDVTICKDNICYTTPSQETLDAELKAQQVQDAIKNSPENKFNKDLFDSQLGQTTLVNNPSLLTMVGAMDRFIDFKNFQAIANVIAAMLKGGQLTQSEVDTFSSVMENQQINLITYNSDLSVD